MPHPPTTDPRRKCGAGVATSRVLAVTAAALVVLTLVALPLPEGAQGLAVAVSTLLGAGFMLAGLRINGCAGPTVRLTVAATATNLVFILVWSLTAFGGPGLQTQSSPADAGLIVANLLLAAALVVGMMRRERPLTVSLDLAAIAVGAGVVLAVIVGSALEQPERTGTMDALVAVAYLAADLALIACALRVVLAPKGRPPALWMLAGAATAFAATDIVRNQVIVPGSAGAWVYVGWGVAPILIGLAALHPSLRRLDGKEDPVDDFRATSAVVLGVTSVMAPMILALHHFVPGVPDVDESTLFVAVTLGGGLIVAALVITRFMLLVRRTREVARRSESRYYHLVEQVPAVVLVFRIVENQPTPVYVGPQAEAILGLLPEALIARPSEFRSRVHADDREALQTALRAQLDGEPPARPEFRFLRPDGELIWVRDVSGVVTEEHGERFLQSMVVDITDAKQAEADRERMEGELQLAQKLEAVGQLAAGIAHEINTPIQFIGDTFHFLRDAFDDMLALAVIEAELRDAAATGDVPAQLIDRARELEEVADLEYLRDRVPAALNRGVDGVSRVAAIVRAMRDFAHPPTSEKYPVDIVSALHDALIVAVNAYKYVADVDMDFEELPDVVCNGGEIVQVFLNLVINAAHAIENVVGDSGGRGTITLRTRAEGNHVVVSVGDTGSGIPDDVASRVFDPFFTTKEVGRGTGQGLALARTMVVERHGGALTFETEPGRGTTFHVRLPVGEMPELLEAA